MADHIEEAILHWWNRDSFSISRKSIRRRYELLDSYYNEALVYAVYGSKADRKIPMKDMGKPTIKRAKETEEDIDLEVDPETTMAGMGKLDYTLVSDKQVKESIDDLIQELEYVDWDGFESNGVNYASPQQFNQLMDTTAKFYSNEERIQHAKKMKEKMQ